MSKYWKSKKSFQKSNGQIFKFLKSFQKSNGQIFKFQKIIPEIKRTNFGNKKKIVIEIKRTKFGYQNQTYKTRIKTQYYFSDTPRTPYL